MKLFFKIIIALIFSWGFAFFWLLWAAIISDEYWDGTAVIFSILIFIFWIFIMRSFFSN